ncbi:MAG: hypothetical protein ABIW47_04510 [Ginsengibacter sp.]|jgi:hypothetical protein
MHTIERKIHLIEEVLKAENDNVLDALENALINTKKKKDNKLNIKDFVGVISKGEAEQLKKIIKETAETIHENDWT